LIWEGIAVNATCRLGRVVAFAAAVLFSGIIVTTLSAQAPAPQGRGQAPPAATGPMAPEKYKNIQMLTDVPADQLDLTMRYIVAATGIQCVGCHVMDEATGELQPEKDDKAGKKTARQMMNLVKTINAGDFGARVSCGTCHAGRNQPAGLQTATMMTTEQIAAAAQAAATRQGGPGATGAAAAPGGQAGPAGRGAQPPAVPVDDVLSKYIDALGGRPAIEKLQALVISGTVTNRAAQSVAFTIEEKGNKYRESMQEQPDAVTRAFDGTAGWEQVGSRVAGLDLFPLQQTLRSADLGLALTVKDKYTNLQAGRAMRIPAATPGGMAVAVNVIQGSPAQYVTEQFMFDSSSGLLVRRIARTATGLRGQLVEQFDYSDYRVVAGVKLPFEVRRSNWNTFDTFKVTDIKANTMIADARFIKPRN
jgi:hypothetical protein